MLRIFPSKATKTKKKASLRCFTPPNTAPSKMIVVLTSYGLIEQADQEFPFSRRDPKHLIYSSIPNSHGIE